MVSTANASLEEYSTQEENQEVVAQENCKNIQNFKDKLKCYKDVAAEKAKVTKEKAEEKLREKNKCWEEESTKECLSRVSKEKYEQAKEKAKELKEKAKNKYAETKEKAENKIVEAKEKRATKKEKGEKTNISDKLKTRLDNKIDRFLERLKKLDNDKQIETLEKIHTKIEDLKVRKISKIQNEDKRKTYEGIFDYFNQRIMERIEELKIDTEVNWDIDNLLQELN